MRALLTAIALGLSACLLGSSCQPAPEEQAPPRKPSVFDYTMLGIWPERYMAYNISVALQEAGIQSEMSGHGPSVLNVESSKLIEANAIIASNPAWVESAVVLKQHDDIF